MIHIHAEILDGRSPRSELGTQIVQSTDQATHKGLQIPLGAIITAVLARGMRAASCRA